MNNFSEKEIDFFSFKPVNSCRDNKDISIFALKESVRWYNHAAGIITKCVLNQEAYVMMLYSIELTLKSLLSWNNINILQKKYRIHNVKKLYEYLPYALATEIRNNVKVEKVVLPPDINYHNKSFETFDDYLDEISNDFIMLRYEYGQFHNNSVIFVPNQFITDFADKILYIAGKTLNVEIRKI